MTCLLSQMKLSSVRLVILSILWRYFRCTGVTDFPYEDMGNVAESSGLLTRRNDFVLVNCSVYVSSDKRIDEPFILWHSDLCQWRNQLSNFSLVHNLLNEEQERLQNQIFQYLVETEKFSSERLLRDLPEDESITTLSMLEKLLTFNLSRHSISESAHTDDPFHSLIQDEHFFFTNHDRRQYPKILRSFPRIIDYYEFLQEQEASYQSIVPSFFLTSPDSRIIVYQTRNAFTGGTTAMRILATTLIVLGYPVVLCNDSNYDTVPCREPRVQDIAITGEWCQEVLEEYVNTSASNHQFLGRGIQYYLGFHHGRHSCRGWIATTDSHYLSHQLGTRLLHSLFLGCPMSERILDKLEEIISCLFPNPPYSTSSSSPQCTDFIDIEKENLILLDYDFFQDYPTHPLRFQLELPVHPSNQSSLFQILLLTGDIANQRMSYYLQRAKYVIDLALPGPERISSEAILFGAIPILSHRWNGKSNLDFPVKYKLDLFQFTSILSHTSSAATDPMDHEKEALIARFSSLSTLLSNILPTYAEEIIKDPDHHMFYEYILSMSFRLQQTADRFFGSQYYQIEIIATTLEEELLAIFQILSWIYEYPLINIRLYVVDMIWFMKHYYLFIDLMIQSGYLRYDPHDPRDHQYRDRQQQNQFMISYLQIDSIFTLQQKKQLDNTPWKRIIIEVPVGIMISNCPTFLFQLTKSLEVEYTIDQLQQIQFQTLMKSETTDRVPPEVKINYYYIDPELPFPEERVVISRDLPSTAVNNSNNTSRSPRVMTVCELLQLQQSSLCSYRICEVQQLPIWMIMQQVYLRQLHEISEVCGK